MVCSRAVLCVVTQRPSLQTLGKSVAWRHKERLWNRHSNIGKKDKEQTGRLETKITCGPKFYLEKNTPWLIITTAYPLVTCVTVALWAKPFCAKRETSARKMPRLPRLAYEAPVRLIRKYSRCTNISVSLFRVKVCRSKLHMQCRWGLVFTRDIVGDQLRALMT